MTLLFKIQNKLVTITDASMAKLSLGQVALPVIQSFADSPYQNLDIKKIACIDTGDALYLSAKKTDFTLTATIDTTSCIQAFIYNADGETCLIHYNASFMVDWSELLNKFTDKNLFLILIGATNRDPKSATNVAYFFSGLINYLQLNSSITLTLTHQLLLEHNIRLISLPHGLFKGPIGYTAILKSVAFDKQGNVIDVEPIQDRLTDFQVGTELRNARRHEAEHRDWMSKHLRTEFYKPFILLLTQQSTSRDVEINTYFHQAMIDFANYIITKQLQLKFSDKLAKAVGKSGQAATGYSQNLVRFIQTIYDFSQSAEYAALKASVQKHPAAPLDRNILSYGDSYLEDASAVADSFLNNTKVTYKSKSFKS